MRKKNVKLGALLLFVLGLTGLQAQTVKDFDGNVYHTVTIGVQTWMVENLKVTHYRNGDPIPNVTNDLTWRDLTSGASCDFKNTPAQSETYGKLYNWYAVTDSHNVCPTGWHVPSDSEWTILTDYLGGETVAGGKLKETGTTHWLSPNADATNETGFTALPGYSRSGTGLFNNIGNVGFWWSSTEGDSFSAWYRQLYFNGKDVYRSGLNKTCGYSVRCLRDY